MPSKRLSKDQFPGNKGVNANGSRTHKRKFSSVLDSRWSKEELELFYEAYRQYGKDWKKVANAVCSRTLKMVEALYKLNKAYFSLPEGETNTAGFTAMMTDYYNNLEGSDDYDQESRDGLGASRKPEKHIQGLITSDMLKGGDEPCCGISGYQSASSSYECLPLPKEKHLGGPQPHAVKKKTLCVGKRIPRRPVSCYTPNTDRVRIISPNKQHQEYDRNAISDDDVHVDALEITEASDSWCSVQAFRSPIGGRGHMRSSVLPQINKKDVEDSASVEGQYDHTRGTCSGVEEAVILSNLKGKSVSEGFDGKSEESSWNSGNRNVQLFFGDESATLDALRILANLSVEVPGPYFDVESGCSSIQQ